MRLFVSILLPDIVKLEILRIQHTLGSTFHGTLIKPDNLHITLAFFGNVPDEEIPELYTKLNSIQYPQLFITLDHLGVNSMKHPHVLWVSVQASGLAILAHAIQECVPNAQEMRPFNPHITIARIKHIDKFYISQLLATQVTPITWLTKEYALQESKTLPEGPLYTTLGIFTLEEIE